MVAVPALGTAAEAVTRTFNVAPRTGLVDLQRVTVAGRGFSPNVQIATVECRPGAVGQSDCDLGTLVYGNSDSKGSFSFQRYVRRLITVGGKQIDCAGKAGCILGAANIGNLKQTGGKTIFFNPKIPPKVQKVAVSPNTGLVDHQLVTVSGSGFVPSTNVSLQECLAAGSSPGICDYATQRLVKTNGKGGFTAQNFVLERRQVTYGPKGQKRLDCAESPKRCVVVARPGTFYSANPPMASLTFDPHTPPVNATAQLSPASGLVDLQSITVTGAGFTPGYAVTIEECVVAKTQNQSCDYSTVRTITADLHGAFTASYWVRRKISTYSGTSLVTTDCGARSGACTLTLFGSPSQPSPSVPLDFDAAVPAVPATVSAAPDTGLVNDQRVSVTIGGFTPDHPVELIECTADAVDEADLSYCDYGTAIVTTPGGPTGQASFVVRSTIGSNEGPEDCTTAPGACVLVAVGTGGVGGGYSTPAAVPHKVVPLGSLPNTASTDLAFAT